MSLLLSRIAGAHPGAPRTPSRGAHRCLRTMLGASYDQSPSSWLSSSTISSPPLDELHIAGESARRSSNSSRTPDSWVRRHSASSAASSLGRRTTSSSPIRRGPQPPPHGRSDGRAAAAAALYHSSVTDSSPYKHLDREAVTDLFQQYAKLRDGQCSLDANDIVCLLKGIGEPADDEKIEQLFRVADLDGNGVIDLEEFLDHADTFIGDNPARIILVIGGPGSGKGVLSRRLEAECNVVHLSSGSLLRDEVQRQTPLGRQVQDIISQGQLVSSAIMVALMKKRMRDHPGKRVLLDGFPRSLENAHDLVTLCGKPELALHLVCDDTILMERIMKRGENRQDDNFETALNRIRTYHKYHHHTLEWLREQHVPIVNLDCTGPPESVWQQMTAIGKLMRPAVKLSHSLSLSGDADDSGVDDWSSDPQRTSALF